ncbi:glutamate racemase [Flavobacteriales bacterium]|nr:Glutamate racemase 1 [Flavobacteriales bacterium]MCL4815507.1 glutamate racemase [Flavobacteriales bacterium]WKZ75125.1 MAG: glutamate racemase [Vicingaceae bacterium]GIK70897.1 MAG: glutamate racemase [Bacteroidota bacterium]CAG0963383.1 glutamate racemase [Flavobacteriales bacterium]
MKQIINPSQPIGIFDSGIGGLTVASAIKKILPNENIVYFGDTAHFPYGEKSEDSIKFYAIKIARFLLQKNCKTIIIACNTASAHAYNVVKEFAENKVEVINVIDPIVNYVSAKKEYKRIGVIGTKGTIKSNVYENKIKQISKNIEVVSLATPLLAPMIEEGFFNNNISKTIIQSYLSKPRLKKIDCLILACTHYPLIKKEITDIYKKQFEIIDSAEIVALQVKNVLTQKKLLNKNNAGKHHFYISDYTPSFGNSASMFFGSKISLSEQNIWI